MKRAICVRACVVSVLYVLCLMLTGATWPNGPDEDPALAPPNDPEYGRRCGCKPGKDCDVNEPVVKKYNGVFCFHDKDCGGSELLSCQGEGQWNFWSVVPDEWAKNAGFNTQEVKLGTGMHADRAWQVTTGSSKVVIAVMDSGIYWEHPDLINKYYLNRKELPLPQDKDGKEAKDYDANGDGVFNILDYKDDPRVSDKNGNKKIDPGDLIVIFSDGKDDDNNGYIDDISGWDFFWNDNNAADETRYGHGEREARQAAAEGNNNVGSIGVCPKCMILPIRVGDSFICDVNHFAVGVAYAVDMKAQVILEALGTLNNTTLARKASAYAWRNGTLIVASAADENSYHHNYPGNYLHNLYVHAIRYDGQKAGESTTFLNHNNCTNYGGKLTVSVPGIRCSSEATGRGGGHAGMIYSAGLKFLLNPVLNASEVYQIFNMSADDVKVPGSASNPDRYPSKEGWDMRFGYGRTNVRKSVDMVRFKAIPPTALITYPRWFHPLYPTRESKVEIKGRLEARRHKSYDYVVEVAKSVRPEDKDFETLHEEKGLTKVKEGTLVTWDMSKASYEKTPAKANEPHRFAYTLRVRVIGYRDDGKTDVGEFRKTVHLMKDPDLLPGFPKYLDAGGASSPKMIDLDGDGKAELILATENGVIHALKADGTEAKGWPVKTSITEFFDPSNKANHLNAPAFKNGVLSNTQSQSVLAAPGVGDLDGDGKPEVVIATMEGEVLVFSNEGKPRDGFPVKMDKIDSTITSKKTMIEQGIMTAPTLYDLDGDGTLEIIVGAMDANVYVWKHDGTVFSGFPVMLSDKSESTPQRYRILTSPAVGDVDGDGKPEMFMSTNELYGDKNSSRLYCIRYDGTFCKGWPVKVPSIANDVFPYVGRGLPNNPVLADMDKDGQLDVVTGALFGYVFVFGADGNIKSKSDHKDFGGGSDSTETQMLHSVIHPAVGDLNGDGYPDIVSGGAGFNFLQATLFAGLRRPYDHLLAAWSGADGTFLAGWPKKIEDHQFFANPIIVDITGDKKPEVISGTGGYLLHAFQFDGTPAAGWPKHTSGWIASAATTGDLTGDGMREVFVHTREGWLFGWRSTGETSVPAQWASHHHDLRNTGNTKTALPVTVPKTNAEGKGEVDAGGRDVPVASGGCGGCAVSSPVSWWGVFLLLLFGWKRRRGGGA